VIPFQNGIDSVGHPARVRRRGSRAGGVAYIAASIARRCHRARRHDGALRVGAFRAARSRRRRFVDACRARASMPSSRDIGRALWEKVRASSNALSGCTCLRAPAARRHPHRSRPSRDVRGVDARDVAVAARKASRSPTISSRRRSRARQPAGGDALVDAERSAGGPQARGAVAMRARRGARGAAGIAAPVNATFYAR
jgi:hypothetical protein